MRGEAEARSTKRACRRTKCKHEDEHENEYGLTHSRRRCLNRRVLNDVPDPDIPTFQVAQCQDAVDTKADITREASPMVAMVLVTHGLGIEDLPIVQRFLRSVFWNLELHARASSIHETRTSPTDSTRPHG